MTVGDAVLVSVSEPDTGTKTVADAGAETTVVPIGARPVASAVSAMAPLSISAWETV